MRWSCKFLVFSVKFSHHVRNLSAEKKKTRSNARFQEAQPHERRTPSPKKPLTQRPETAFGLEFKNFFLGITFFGDRSKAAWPVLVSEKVTPSTKFFNSKSSLMVDIPKKQMVPRVPRELFQRVFEKGRSYHSPHFLLRVLQDGQRGQSAFGVSVSSKFAKTAVLRNLLKRRMRTIFREVSGAVKSSHVFIFSLKRGSEGLSFGELRKEAVELLKKSHLLN